MMSSSSATWKTLACAQKEPRQCAQKIGTKNSGNSEVLPDVPGPDEYVAEQSRARNYNYKPTSAKTLLVGPFFP